MTDIETELKRIAADITLTCEHLTVLEPGTVMWSEMNDHLLMLLDVQADLNENAVNQ